MKTVTRPLFFFCFVIYSLIFMGSCKNEVSSPVPVYPVPSETQLAWHEMEMNAFIHFTTNTFTDMEWGYGDESEDIFNPSELDANQWVSTLKEAGFKGVILTCKHHDGFCLWPSEFTEHSVKNSPYKNGQGDVVKELSDACKKHEMKFGVYVSPWDRYHPDYGRPEYITYFRNQLTEIFSNYGEIFEMWFDGANGGDGYYGGAREFRDIDGSTYYDWPTTLDLIRNIQSDVLFFSDAGPDLRWIGNEGGYAGETNWSTLTPDTLYTGKPGKVSSIKDLLNSGSIEGTCWIPGEADVSIRPGWFYHATQDTLVKTPQKLFDIYLKSVGRGAVLLLNVPPDKRGLFHENDIQSLQGFRQLLDETFANNLAANAKVKASSVRGKSSVFSPRNLIDGDKDSYWATDDGVISGYFEAEFDKPQVVSFILLQEYIRLGQRIKAFNVEVWKEGGWEKVSEATTAGYKRILKIDPVETSKVRVNILDSKAALVISNFEVY